MTKLGEFSHIEFPADDLERAKAFYASVFGWQFSAMEGYEDYFLYEAGPGGLGGGFGVRGRTAGAKVRNYLGTDDIDATLAKVASSGGTVVEPKTDIGIGWYATLLDTEGSEIAVYQAKPRD
jgi:hypothetical protein